MAPILVKIEFEFHPISIPKLFAYYLMSSERYYHEYSGYFGLDETVPVTIGCSTMELYLGDCDIEVISDPEKINSYKILHGQKFTGNFDILSFLDDRYSYGALVSKRRKKITSEKPKEPPKPPKPPKPGNGLDLLLRILAKVPPAKK